MERICRALFHLTGRFGAVVAVVVGGVGVFGLMSSDGFAQAGRESAPAAMDPSDAYFQGWLLSKDAEKLREEERFDEALEKLRRAREIFDTIAHTFPTWREDMVKRRRGKTVDTIAEVMPKAMAQRDKKAEATAELEGGVQRQGTRDESGGGDVLDLRLQRQPQAPSRPRETLDSRRVAELERKVNELRQRAEDAARMARENRQATTTEAERSAKAVREARQLRQSLEAAEEKAARMARENQRREVREAARISKLEETIRELRRKAAKGGGTGDESEPGGDEAAQREIAKLEEEIRQLRKVATDATRQNREAEMREIERVAEMKQQIRELQSQVQSAGMDADQQERRADLAIAELQQAKRELDSLRRKASQQPMREDLEALAKRINELESEKAAIAETLQASRGETLEAKEQIEALQAERARLTGQVADLQQKVANAERDLQLERQMANEVVGGQLSQIKQLQSRLKSKDKELDVAHRKIDDLKGKLDEVRASYDDLEKERDALLRERDQMAALLKLNKAGQLQEVINQNMALDRQLRESKERFDILKEDNSATKDELLEAKQGLAISKLRIREYRREKAEQQERIESLQQRLREEEQSLASAKGGDPAETEMLRAIIRKQIKIQEKRRQASKILMATLSEKAEDDPAIKRALSLYHGAELNLSPEEMKVIDGHEVDGVIISPFARPRDEVAKSLTRLEAELEPYQRAGTRAYLNGRHRAARESFEIIVERNPGDVGAMCRLGLVEFKLERYPQAVDTFRRATELEPRNPYARRMLGHTLGKAGEYDEAREALEEAIELAPNHAETHLMLGNTLYQLRDFSGAEEAFKTTLACEPTNAEANYNLAILHARADRKKEGLAHYREALNLGAPPNLELEKQLSQ